MISSSFAGRSGFRGTGAAPPSWSVMLGANQLQSPFARFGTSVSADRPHSLAFITLRRTSLCRFRSDSKSAPGLASCHQVRSMPATCQLPDIS